MTIVDKTVLVTGANRGIGRALVSEALTRGASRVYAGTHRPLAQPDGRFTPLTLDVTDAVQSRAAAAQVGPPDIPKSPQEWVARAIFDGVDNRQEDILPDPLSASAADSWRDGAAKELECQNAALAQVAPGTA